VAQKTVAAYRRRLGIELSWEQARSSEEFRRKQHKRAEAFIKYTRERWRQWRERRRLAWEKLKRDFAQRPDRPPARICRECGGHWYASREFYHMRVRRLPDRVRINYCRVCRLCRAERRRDQASAGPAASAAAAGRYAKSA
jgi:hypothetical protein